MHKKILITGATGNVGRSVVKYLSGNHQISLILGVRDVERALKSGAFDPDVNLVEFDFEDFDSYQSAFYDVDIVFLLRPPHISDVNRYFKPLIDTLVDKRVEGIVFLSVQGADTSSFIPHYKIEKLIVDSGIPYVFVRPGYFMQNLITTLREDVLEKKLITLPAGRAVFNWVDVENIGEASAALILNFEKYQNKAFDITGYENLSFRQATEVINQNSSLSVNYRSVNLLKFFWYKRSQGMKTPFILVMIMLHFLPRFQKPPRISTFFEQLTGKKPTTLEEFVLREQIFHSNSR
jgi:uncharacterized protein YbjT (DUF2867 family)